MRSNNHLGVSLMAMTHAAASAPHVNYACDTHYPWQTEKDEVVVGGRIKFVNGCVQNTNKPVVGAGFSTSDPAETSATTNWTTASVTTKPKCASA